MDHASPLDLGFLSLISSGIAATGPLWEPLVRFADGAVADELLLTSERYEVWLRCWAPGAQTELDPAGNVAYTVVRGSLVGHDVGGDQAELVHVGETRSVPTGVRYGLADLDDGPAVSIHAVSLAVPAMTESATRSAR